MRLIKWVRKIFHDIKVEKFVPFDKVTAITNEEPHLYLCDPNKNTECRKTGCHLIGGLCYHTTHAEFAKGEENETN